MVARRGHVRAPRTIFSASGEVAPPSSLSAFLSALSWRSTRRARWIWIELAVIDRLTALRQSGESYSDVIPRLVELEAKGRP